MKKGSNIHKGFTLIELILYVSILTLVLTAFITFAWNSIQTGVKSTVQQEVSANARYISERIKHEIRNSTDINLPAVSSSGTTLDLTTSTTTTSPTIIELDIPTGNIRIKQGTGGVWVSLNSANTTISSLTFTNYSSVDNKTKHIQYNMTISAKYDSTRQEYKGNIVIEGSAELRSN